MVKNLTDSYHFPFQLLKFTYLNSAIQITTARYVQ